MTKNPQKLKDLERENENIDLDKRNKELTEELEKQNNELKNTIEHLQRLQAEFQNYQKRIECQVRMHKEYAAFDLTFKLLNVMDDFENAIKNLQVEDEEIVKGVKMIFNNLKKTLEDHGLREIKSVGDKFDPFKHEPIQKVNVDGKKDGEIVEEIQKGYMFKEKLLRPSRVKVASGELFLRENFGKEIKKKEEILGGK